MEIAIIGLGGVGGYFGFKLAHAFGRGNGASVTFVARKATYEAVKERGLALLSPEHEDQVVKPDLLLSAVEALAKPDLVLICVKEYDLEQVCQQLGDKVSESTIILPLINGVDIYDRIRKVITKGIVLPACVYVASHIKEKGVVEHKGKPGLIVFGKDPAFPQYVPEEVIGVFRKAGIQHQYQEDAFPDIWAKFVFIASFGLMTARYNQPIGKVNEEEELKERALSIMKEIVTIAGLKGVVLPSDIIDQTFEKASGFPYHTPTSLQLDIHSGKSDNELELFAGAILKHGEEVKLPTPETRRVYEEIKKPGIKRQ
jgi:2-dehydropantoate 2-reductase